MYKFPVKNEQGEQLHSWFDIIMDRPTGLECKDLTGVEEEQMDAFWKYAKEILYFARSTTTV
jgi:hypothetical protein